MGFILTLLYISLALLSTERLLPSLKEYRVELVVAVVAVLCSLPGFLDRRFYRTPQVYLLGGMLSAVFVSQVLDSYWLGGGFLALQQFLSFSVVFFLVLFNCQSLRRLKILALLLVLIALAYILEGSRAYLTGDVTSPLLIVIPAHDGGVSFRMQGQGFLYDPNDLAQFLVMTLPFIWMGWQQRANLRNLFLVVAPTALFVWGIYLTHSRGGMLAMVVILMFALSRRLKPVLTAIGGGLALAAGLALNFSGGREISVKSGSDRLTFWGDGLQMFKQSPIFGIGFHNFGGHDFGHTAHNSFVVCLAELGLFGYLPWIGLMVFTLAGLTSLIRMAKPKLQLGSEKRKSGDFDPTVRSANESLDLPEGELAEVERWAWAFRISIAGFITAGMFLSRAYVITLYVVLGMAVSLFWLVSSEDRPIVREPARRLLKLTVAMGVGVIAAIYLTLRLRGVLSFLG